MRRHLHAAYFAGLGVIVRSPVHIPTLILPVVNVWLIPLGYGASGCKGNKALLSPIVGAQANRSRSCFGELIKYTSEIST